MNNVSLLSAAVFSESINCVKRLLEHGANTDTQVHALYYKSALCSCRAVYGNWG